MGKSATVARPFPITKLSLQHSLFLRLALTTVLTFIILFAPFLPPFSPLVTIAAPITRIFPSGRGLFEDKVANFWCFRNVLVLEWKRVFDGREGVLIKPPPGLLLSDSCLLLPRSSLVVTRPGCKQAIKMAQSTGLLHKPTP